MKVLTPFISISSGRTTRTKTTQRPGQPQRGVVGVLQRQRLGNQLAEDDVQERDEQEGQHGGDGVRGDGVPAAEQPVERRVQQRGQGRFADEAQADARQGDAELRAGDGAAQVAHRGIDRPGALDAAGDQFFHAGFADGHQRVLGGHEQSVQCDESRDGEQAQGDPEIGTTILGSGEHVVPRKEGAKSTVICYHNTGRPTNANAGAPLD